MATWLAHLRIAQALLPQFPFEESAFLAGNIGADCGLPSEGGFIPPKEVTHFARSNRFCDFNRFYKQFIEGESDPLRLSFYWGYFAHLMSDCLWCELINEPTKERFRELYACDRTEFYRLVKRDWYDNDFLFLEQQDGFPPLDALRAAVLPADLLPYYTENNIAIQQENIWQFYHNKREGIHREYPYLTAQQYEHYVSTVAGVISAEITKYFPKG